MDPRLRALVAVLLGAGQFFKSKRLGEERDEEQQLRRAADERAERSLALREEDVGLRRQERAEARQEATRQRANVENQPLLEMASRVAASSAEPSAFTASALRRTEPQTPQGVASETIPLALEGGAVTPASMILQRLAGGLRSGGDVSDLGGLVSRASTGGQAERMVRDFESGRDLEEDLARREATLPQRLKEAQQFADINARTAARFREPDKPDRVALNEQMERHARGRLTAGTPKAQVTREIELQFGIPHSQAAGLVDKVEEDAERGTNILEQLLGNPEALRRLTGQ